MLCALFVVFVAIEFGISKEIPWRATALNVFGCMALALAIFQVNWLFTEKRY
jgi:hypothetical protein